MDVGVTVSILCLLVMMSSMLVDSYPRPVRQAGAEPGYRTVQTTLGAVRGRRIRESDDMDLDIFLGIPYAQPPVGDLRLARPLPATPWQGTRDALRHGAKCVQRIIEEDPPLVNVPFEEDCLFLDIYTSRSRNSCNQEATPTMLFVHGGGYYGGTGALYNFTNVALRGVTVVTINYRLDVFGFLSSSDDVIPGNFGLLDQALALDWVKENIAAFGGKPDDITIFGGSAGASSSSILTLSPLTRGKFQKAIMQSGVANCNWAVHPPGNKVAPPRNIALEFGRRLNCSLTKEGTELSHELLDCLRAKDVTTLVNTSVDMQIYTYGGSVMIWSPVVENVFGVIPDTPANLLRMTDDLVHIPTIYGYTEDDGSLLVSDPEGDGVTVPEFVATTKFLLRVLFGEAKVDDGYAQLEALYLPNGASALSPIELRDILVRLMTDGYMVSCTVEEARLFSRSKDGNSKSYIYEFDHRPSYSTNPEWKGVAHADEKGFVLGLPNGRDPFNYPVVTSADRAVSDYVVTMWTNFAKYGNPTPEPVGSVTWPEFGPNDIQENILSIQETPVAKAFDRNEAVTLWSNIQGDN